MRHRSLFLIWLWLVGTGANARCPRSATAPLSYLLEHAVWRGWHQTIIYTPDLEPGGLPVIIIIIIAVVGGHWSQREMSPQRYSPTVLPAGARRVAWLAPDHHLHSRP
ncbi:hypothetical protein O0L34_g2123 [Tuta absoluta]|nr:hypothetical protein O0L34_g2123 [Tuta absoluta]